jgi:hypothetical protein
MELSKEEEYERIQNLYVRPYQTYQTYHNVNCSVPSNSPIQSAQTQVIDTIATIKTPCIQTEDLKEKIEESILCECGGKYSHFNKNRHYNTKKHKNATLSSLPVLVLQRENTVEGSSP